MRRIEFSLLYRDMWQSSGKYQPRKTELEEIAPVFIDMGCLKRVETNGGGFEQVTLLYGDNPNHSLRSYLKILKEGGIQSHMLERALNGIRMYPVPADVRELFFKVKQAQGVDIARSFCGLNDSRNLELSIKYAKQSGMISQACIALTYSRVHTVNYYLKLVDVLVEMGADEICIKDMAGIGRPYQIGQIVSGIKKSHPKTLVQYHGHSGPGLAPASILQAVLAGADCVDVAMQPLSWGTGHVDLLSAIEILRGVPDIEVPEVNMSAYMKARELTQKFIDDWLGFYINPMNRYMNSLLIGPGLPGGMMGSLMGWIEDTVKRVNKWAQNNNKDPFSLDQIMIMLFEEVQKTWHDMGYPPLVTPFSQYVAVTALSNVELAIKGEPRFSRIDTKTWGMITGKSGKLPGPLSKELIELANEQGYEFFEGTPQELYPNQLDEFKKEMQENGWDHGQDDEELFELAMHPEQYRDYKSGVAAQKFEADLEEKRAAKTSTKAEKPGAAVTVYPAKAMVIVNGKQVLTEVIPVFEAGTPLPAIAKPDDTTEPKPEKLDGEPVLAIEGVVRKILAAEGEPVTKGATMFVIEAMKVENNILAPVDGIVGKIVVKENHEVEEDQVLTTIH